MFRPVTPRQQRIIGNTRAHKRDSKLYACKAGRADDTGDTSVARLLWPQAPAPALLEVEPFLVKVEEKDLHMNVDVQNGASQSGEGARVKEEE